MHPEKARGAASLSVSYLTEAAGLHASFILVEIDVTTVKSVNLRAIPLRERVREMERARGGYLVTVGQQILFLLQKSFFCHISFLIFYFHLTGIHSLS